MRFSITKRMPARRRIWGNAATFRGRSAKARLACLALVACHLAACDRASPAPNIAEPKVVGVAPKPNIVLLIIDTLRADTLGLYGNPLKPTPEIDKLGASGIVFNNVVAPCSWTRPSIGSLLTSMYPRTLGLYREENERLREADTTLAEILKSSGYATYGATANPNINVVFGFSQGFDEYVDSDVVLEWMPHDEGAKLPGNQKLESAKSIFAKALDYAAKQPHGPSYLQLNIMDVHEYRPRVSLTRPEFKQMYESTPNGAYVAGAAQASNDLGAFLEELLSLPGWSETLVVIVSDHGEGLDSHPLVMNSARHGELIYESTISVPWIICGPALKDGPLRVTEQVGLIDVVPTLLNLIGIESNVAFVGTDVLRPSERGKHRSYFVETQFRGREKYGVYDLEWKLFHNIDDLDGLPSVELQRRFVYENGVQSDRAKRYPRIVDGLLRELEAWKKDFPASAPTPLDSSVNTSTVEQLRNIGYL